MAPQNWNFSETGSPLSVKAAVVAANLPPKSETYMQEFVQLAILANATECSLIGEQTIIGAVKTQVKFQFNKAVGKSWEFKSSGDPETLKAQISERTDIEDYARYALQRS